MLVSPKTLLFLAVIYANAGQVSAVCKKNGAPQPTGDVTCDFFTECYSVEDCDSAICRGDGCYKTVFTNVDKITCGEFDNVLEGSCAEAQFNDVGDVTCVSQEACARTEFFTAQSVLCEINNNSCNSAAFYNVGSVVCQGISGCAFARFDNVDNVKCSEGPGEVVCLQATFNSCNTVLCEEWTSCQNARFNDCGTVVCKEGWNGGVSCSGATIDANHVTCTGSRSCSRASIQATDVVCETSACVDGTDIAASKTLVCKGSGACEEMTANAKQVFCADRGCKQGDNPGIANFDTPCLICEEGNDSCEPYHQWNGEPLGTTFDTAPDTVCFGNCAARVCPFCNMFPSSPVDFDLDGDPDCEDEDADGTLDACEAGFGGVKGDPHISRWNQKSFDFHGECDLMMLHSDHVNDNKPFDLHVRTTLTEAFSSIESAALKVGEELVEIDVHKLYYKGQVFHDDDLPLVTSEFTVSEPVRPNGFGVRRDFNIVLKDKSTVIVRKTKSYLSISVEGHHHDFEHSHGLLGDFFTGDPLGRDGRIIEDWVEYGMEWQVLPDEPKLFQEDREPQLPYARCTLPSEATTSKARRLRSKNNSLAEAAQVACAHAGEEIDACISDVLLTGDLSAAEAF